MGKYLSLKQGLLMDNPAYFLVGHGSRDPEANREFEELVGLFAARHPESIVRHGFVELAKPGMYEALEDLAQEANHIVMMPLMFFLAGHMKHDLFLLADFIRRKNPDIQLQVTDPVGLHPIPLSIAFEKAQNAFNLDDKSNADTALLFVGRGSSDPDAKGDLYKATRLLAEGRGFASATPAFVGIAEPSIPEALDQVGRSRPEKILLVPYLFFTGSILEKITKQAKAFAKTHSWIKVQVSKHLGAHPRMVDLLDERVKQTLEGNHDLAYDHCQYRVPLAGLDHQVGGLA